MCCEGEERVSLDVGGVPVFVMGDMHAPGRDTSVAVLGVSGYEDGVVILPLARGYAAGPVDVEVKCLGGWLDA